MKDIPHKDQPHISVIMSVFNSASYLRQSVDSLLSQSLEPSEIIIIDDASTDETPGILDSYGSSIRVFRNADNLGLTRSLNLALKQATGELIARQDADDISMPDRFERQSKAILADPSRVLVGSGFQGIDSVGNIIGGKQLPMSDKHIRYAMCFHNAFCHSSTLFSRMALQAAGGGYDETIRYAQDFELWSRLSKLGSLCNLPEPVIKLRFHEASITSRHGDAQWNTSTEISRVNFERVMGESISFEEMDRLRKFWGRFPDHMSREDWQSAALFLKVLGKIGEKHSYNFADRRAFVKPWFDRFTGRLNRDSWRLQLNAGIPKLMFAADAPMAATSLLLRVARRILGESRYAQFLKYSKRLIDQP